jgi:hypothetical protein
MTDNTRTEDKEAAFGRVAIIRAAKYQPIEDAPGSYVKVRD